MNKDKSSCIANSCTDDAKVLGFCLFHYQRHRLGKDVNAPRRNNRKNGENLIRDSLGRKFCIVCEEFLPEANFQAHGSTLDKKQPYCADCRSSQFLYSTYGITKKDLLTMLEKQGGCAICKTNEPKGKHTWHVDHDHSCCPTAKTCGKCVRGILCSFCNKALGQFNDSIDNLKNAIIYLERVKRDSEAI